VTNLHTKGPDRVQCGGSLPTALGLPFHECFGDISVVDHMHATFRCVSVNVAIGHGVSNDHELAAFTLQLATTTSTSTSTTTNTIRYVRLLLLHLRIRRSRYIMRDRMRELARYLDRVQLRCDWSLYHPLLFILIYLYQSSLEFRVRDDRTR
jgi:hypothetical protein